MLTPLLILAVIILTICCLLGLFVSVQTLAKPSNEIGVAERLQLKKLSTATLFGIIACFAGLFATYEMSIGIFVTLAIDLLMMLFQLLVCHLK